MPLKTSDIAKIGVLAAIVFIATFINIMLPISAKGGLVHLGTPVSVIAVLVFGRRNGTLAGAIGMTMFDILGGFAIWAPITLIARLGLGYILGTFAFSKQRQGNSWLFNSIGLILGGLFMVATYYVGEALLYGNWIAPLGSVVGDVTQIILSFILGFPIAIILKRSLKNSLA